MQVAHDILCWAAQVRVEQVLLSPPPLLLCFQASQLLAFYAATVTSLLGPGAQLAEQLASARVLARRVFGEQLKDRGDKLLRYPPSPPANLFPPSQARLVPRRPSNCRYSVCGVPHLLAVPLVLSAGSADVQNKGILAAFP